MSTSTTSSPPQIDTLQWVCYTFRVTQTETPKTYHRSHSQLASVLRCGEQYRLERLVKPRPPERPASWLALGTAAHSTLAQWEMSDRTIDPLDFFSTAYDTEIEELFLKQPDINMWLKPPVTKSVETDIKNRKKLGFKQIQNYIEDAITSGWEVWHPEGHEKPAVEIGFEVYLGGVKVVGDIDLILYWPSQDAYVIRDLKTGNREKNYLQLGLYGLAARKIFGLDIHLAEYFYLKDGGSSGYRDLGRYTEEYLGTIYHNLDQQISLGLLTPNPGDACGLCTVQEFCREMGNPQ